MAMEINRNYSSYGAQGIRESGAAGNVKKQETENIVKKAGSGKAETDKSERDRKSTRLNSSHM